jgi:hypothetical protein
MNDFQKNLKLLGACDVAVQAAKDIRNPTQAWNECTHITWMDWMIGTLTDRGCLPYHHVKRWKSFTCKRGAGRWVEQKRHLISAQTMALAFNKAVAQEKRKIEASFED